MPKIILPPAGYETVGKNQVRDDTAQSWAPVAVASAGLVLVMCAGVFALMASVAAVLDDSEKDIDNE